MCIAKTPNKGCHRKTDPRHPYEQKIIILSEIQFSTQTFEQPNFIFKVVLSVDEKTAVF